MSLAIRTRGLTRRFGRRWALRGVDLEIESGRVVALLGANGTGKTTLLRVLSTLLKPTAGEVEVLGGRLPETGHAVRAAAALMTPNGHLYDDLSGGENLRFAARMSGVPLDEAGTRAALEAVGLGDAGATRVRGYSTGMRKRLELARLGLRPLSLVLLDEPFASLDDEGVERVQAAIARWKTAGATVVIASHRVAEAGRHADRVVRLERGKVAADPAREGEAP